MSIRQTRCPAVAIAAERFTAVVVLPTPPFWFIMAIDRIERNSFSDIGTTVSPTRFSRLAVERLTRIIDQSLDAGPDGSGALDQPVRYASWSSGAFGLEIM